MEKDHVVLKLDSYNRLRDFRSKILKGEVLKISSHDFTSTQKFYTTDKVIRELTLQNERAQRTIGEFKRKIAELEKRFFDYTHPATKTLTLKDVKKMTTREFKRWRKK